MAVVDPKMAVLVTFMLITHNQEVTAKRQTNMHLFTWTCYASESILVQKYALIHKTYVDGGSGSEHHGYSIFHYVHFELFFMY